MLQAKLKLLYYYRILHATMCIGKHMNACVFGDIGASDAFEAFSTMQGVFESVATYYD